MADEARKPPVKLESRDERISIRLTPTEREMFAEAALAAGDEVSRYIRKVAILGHSIRRAQETIKATGA